MSDLVQAYEQYRDALYHYARRHVGADDAEDLVQQVFLESVRDLARYTEQGQMRAWLYTRMRCRCVDFVRRQGRRPTDPLYDVPSSFDMEDRVIGRVDGYAILARASLSERERQALWLHHGRGFSLEQTGAAMGCSVGAIKALVHRAVVGVRGG